MRFNDMIATVLAGSTERPEAREAQWRQLVDLLAQRQPGAPDAARGEAFAFLREQRTMIEPRVRAAAATSLAGLAIDPGLVVFLRRRIVRRSRRRCSVRCGSAPMTAARAAPRMGPTARALLRHRRRPAARGEGGGSRRFGPSDLVLGGRQAEPACRPSWAAPRIRLAHPGAWSSGSELFSASRREAGGPEAEARCAEGPVAAFRWEAGIEGVVKLVEGAAARPLVG